MKKDCRNDCVEPLRFPARPDNRPGLAHLRYRIGTYATIREALLRNLDKTPGLSGWTHRGADDPGIALLEGASILGDILTFYQELYANEAYLRTARWRESISDLVRLLGYRLSPGLGGSATFAFQIKGEKAVTVPAKFPLKAEVEGLDKPADFETDDEKVAYPWLSSFNLFRPLSTPNISGSTSEFYFELSGAAPGVALKAGDRLMIGEADANASPTRLDNAEIVIVDSVRELLGLKVFKIKGKLKRQVSVARLAAYKLGRTFHHFGHAGPRTITRTPKEITSTATLSTDGKTSTVKSTPPQEMPISFFRKIDGPTQSGDITTSSLYATITASFDKYGMASSPTLQYHKNQSSNYYNKAKMGGASVADYPVDNSGAVIYGVGGGSGKDSTTTSATRIVEPSLGSKEYPLDAEVQDLPAGVSLVIEASLYDGELGGSLKEATFVRSIANIKTTSLTWGLATGTTSLLTLNEALSPPTSGFNYLDIRQVQFHETVSPVLSLRAAPQIATPPTNNTLNFYGTPEQAQSLAGRRIMLVKKGGAPVSASVTSVEAASATDGTHPLLHKVLLDRSDLVLADFPLEPPYPVTVYGNLVDATQGKTEAEATLGNGDNRLVFQTFKLPKSPLTYLLSAGDAPPEAPELQIYVGGRLWRRVGSFFGRKPDEHIYIVREDAENTSWVQFGDGKTGARLPSGVRNVVARYRTGTGAFGALKDGTKVQAGGKLDRLDKVQMPGVAAGGSQPEDGENAREAAPGKIQSLDRLVSLQDFESEALGISGVSRASAAWRADANIPSVVITVLMGTGRGAESQSVAEVFRNYNSSRGPNRFNVEVAAGEREFVVLAATFAYHPTCREEDVRAAIRRALGANDGEVGTDGGREGLFALRSRRFGQREYATSVAGTIQQVEGVVWAQVTRFGSLGVADEPSKLAFPSSPASVAEIVPCPASHILSLYDGHLQLTGAAASAQEVRRDD